MSVLSVQVTTNQSQIQTFFKNFGRKRHISQLFLPIFRMSSKSDKQVANSLYSYFCMIDGK